MTVWASDTTLYRDAVRRCLLSPDESEWLVSNVDATAQAGGYILANKAGSSRISRKTVTPSRVSSLAPVTPPA